MADKEETGNGEQDDVSFLRTVKPKFLVSFLFVIQLQLV